MIRHSGIQQQLLRLKLMMLSVWILSLVGMTWARDKFLDKQMTVVPDRRVISSTTQVTYTSVIDCYARCQRDPLCG